MQSANEMMRPPSSLRRLVTPRSTAARYAFGLMTVALAFGIRMVLIPVTGAGAPFVLFFAATLITAIAAGPGPALAALLLSLPLGATTFVLHAGYSPAQAAAQAALFAIDGAIILHLTVLMARRRRSLEIANQELLRADEERSRALTRLREIIELAPDAYLLAGDDTILTDVNHEACHLLGYGRHEMVGRSAFDFVVPEQHERLRATRVALLEPGTVVKAEWRFARKDGSQVPVEVSSNILPDGRWQAFVRDVSEAHRIADEREAMLAREQAARRQAESANAQLRESEERFRLTIDEAPIAIALVALDGRFVRVNRVLCDITGYSQDELTRRTFQEITHPDDLETDVELLRRLERGDIPRYQLEKRYIRKDGSTVDIMLSTSVLRAPDGAAQYYIAQIEDITARKQAEAALRLSEAKFSGIVSISSDAIITADEHRRITLFNSGAEKVFGYSKEEVLGTPLERLMPERFRAGHPAHFARFAAGAVAARRMGERREIFGLRKNGEEFPAEASISKVTIGDATFFSGVLRDVTQRKQVESALQAAVSARDAVLGVVVHDLRNPLNTITMQASLLEREGPEPERRDQKARLVIMRAARRMNRLIQDLLDVSRVEAGELRMEFTPLSAADLVREAFEANAPLAAAAGLELSLDLTDDVGDVLGDRLRLLQVLDNLLGNALKFTPRGGRIVVRVSASRKEVRFAVADTGSGIAPEGLAHVFDPFWQATARAGRLGAGLGLPITKGIVEAHGGRIWVDSAVGMGSTFSFTIPAAPASDSHTDEVKPVRDSRARVDRRRWRSQRS